MNFAKPTGQKQESHQYQTLVSVADQTRRQSFSSMVCSNLEAVWLWSVVVPGINDGGVSRVMPMMAGSDVQRRLGSRQLDDALATCVVEEVRISLNLRALHSTSHASYFTELHISQNFLPNGGKSRHCEYDAGSSPLLLSGTLPNAT